MGAACCVSFETKLLALLTPLLQELRAQILADIKAEVLTQIQALAAPSVASGQAEPPVVVPAPDLVVEKKSKASKSSSIAH